MRPTFGTISSLRHFTPTTSNSAQDSSTAASRLAMAISEEIITWHPGDITLGQHEGYGLVVLNQPLELPATFYSRIWKNSTHRIGADGGGNRVFDLGHSTPLCLETIIGDLDSLRPDVKQFWSDTGCEIIHDSDQYSTDFTKAVRHLRKLQGSQVQDVVCLGGLGGRVDQGLSTLHHLYIFQKQPGYPSGKMFLLSNESLTFVLQAGKHRIQVRQGASSLGLGKYIGIVPLKEPSIITTDGLEWDVKDWPTELGGQLSTSNHVREDWVTIETSSDVLFTINISL